MRSWPGPARSPDPRKLRNALEHFATGITVVTTVHEGFPYGMTANAFVSLYPPLVLIAADNRTRFHGKVSQSAHYRVSLLSEEQGSRRTTSRAGSARRPSRWSGAAGGVLGGKSALGAGKSTDPWDLDRGDEEGAGCGDREGHPRVLRALRGSRLPAQPP